MEQDGQDPQQAINMAIMDTKTIRVALDGPLQMIKELNLQQVPGGRERALAITNLQQSIMWLGMSLKELGAANPYPNSYNPNNTVVDPTADGLKL